MTLRDKIQENMRTALKQGEKLRLSAIRMLWNGVRNKEIDGKKDLEDAEIIAIINTLAKQRRDSIEQYKQGNRQDLVDKETAELNVLLAYLPEQLSQEDVAKIVEETIRETGAANKADMGKVMKALMPKVTGKADGKLVSQLVREKLGV